jgi:AraC family transcriptional regulator
MIKNIQLRNTLLKRGDFIGRLCKKVDLRDFTIKEIVDRAEEDVPRHTHEDAHFLLIIDGLYITSARGVDQLCSSSALIFNPPGTTHCDRFHTKGGRFLTVSIKSDILACGQSSMGLTDQPIGFSSGEVSWLGLRLYQEFRKPDEMSAIIMEGLALELLGQTLRSRIKSDTSPPRWLQLANQLIHDRLTEPLTVSEIAQSVGSHPVYLVRAFRKHYGLTVGEYLRKLRVEFACRQLSQTDAPLSQVAAAAGFYDQSHFTRTFKRLTGTTPAVYRALTRHKFI